MMFIRAAFEVFKGLVKAGGGASSLSGKGDEHGARSSQGNDVASDNTDQIKKLKMQVQQRDNEINILVSMLQRREAGAAAKGIGGAGVPALQASAAPVLRNPTENTSLSQSSPAVASRLASDVSRQDVGPASSVTSSVDDIAALMNTNLLGDRNKAFELFRKSYRQNEVRL
jgi:kinesin family protein 6/9